jgi:3'-phosphoadenosine 5'-phosphosulfate sulfotransferase (PAPS reductase)/FAD synthetase
MVRILLLSGGKNSTTLALTTKYDHALYVDTGIEFKENVRFVKRLCREYSIPLKVIRPDKPFTYYVFEKPIERGKYRGRKGYGVPTCVRNQRWCCKVLKRDPTYRFLREEYAGEKIELITGYSLGEEHRLKKSLFSEEYGRRFGLKVTTLAPLIDMGWDDATCYEFCRRTGVLNPLYRFFPRFGCRFCPCYTIPQWRTLYFHFPKYFEQAVRLEKRSIRLYGRTFRSDYTLAELAERFERESLSIK